MASRAYFPYLANIVSKEESHLAAFRKLVQFVKEEFATHLKLMSPPVSRQVSAMKHLVFPLYM